MKCFVLVFLTAVPFVNGQILVGCDAAYGWLTCGRRYIFPDTFDVHKLPNDTGNVELGIDGGLPSILKDTFVPIPPRPNLKHLRLINFAYNNNQSIPIASFLSENRISLQIVEIKSGILINLDRETFRGFSALESLTLLNTGLAAVAADSFSALTDGTSEPRLQSVTISSNAITRLDYSVFAPVSHKLQDLKLTGMFETLFVSQPFTFTELRDLDLEYSHLVDLPSPVLETMNNVSLTRLMMHGVPVCTADRACRSCCNLDTLLRWWEPQNGLVFRFQCGRGYACADQQNPADDCLEYYRKENVRDLIDSNLCVSLPTTTGTNWSSTISTTGEANWSTTNMTEAPGSTTNRTTTSTSTTRIPTTTPITTSPTPSDVVVVSCADGVVTITNDYNWTTSATFSGDGSAACQNVMQNMLAAASPNQSGPKNHARGAGWTVVVLVTSSVVAAWWL